MAKKNATVVATVDTATVDTATVENATVDTATVENATVENANPLAMLCSLTDVDQADIAAIQAFEQETATVKAMLSVANLSEDMQKTLLSGVLAKSKGLYAEYIGDIISNGFSFSVGTLLAAQTFLASFDKNLILLWADDVEGLPIDKLQSIGEYIRAKTLLSKVSATEFNMLAKLEKLMNILGFTMADFELGGKTSSSNEAGVKVAAKYQNPDNPAQTWSGRGRNPQWMNDALSKGMNKDDMLINKK